ncbi:LOW QUALITY PROTEIN: hypothetical protein CRUP_018013 [Coryphaenoides rupestris]|nr:LOW QUALITY PROTEIN: hypothetical protein CRUP_018013 [Coryphaenoides rupestris]
MRHDSSYSLLHWNSAAASRMSWNCSMSPASSRDFGVLLVLELLLDFAYSSRIIINEENAESLLEAGDMLQFHDIRDAAAEFLEKNLHSSNCLGMMLLSDAHQCKRLYELSWRMCLVHYETVLESEDFYSLSKDKLLELILSDELEIEDEKVVFNSVMQWVRFDLEGRRHQLPELLRGIRLALLPSECLLEAVACEELVMADKRSRLIVEEAMQCKKRILQNDGVVTSPCARPRKAGHTLLILGGQTFMCDKIYQASPLLSPLLFTCDYSPQLKLSKAAPPASKVILDPIELKGKERSPAHSVTSVNMHRFLSVFSTLSGCDGLWNSEMFMEPVLERDFLFSCTLTDMAASLGTLNEADH